MKNYNSLIYTELILILRPHLILKTLKFGQKLLNLIMLKKVTKVACHILLGGEIKYKRRIFGNNNNICSEWDSQTLIHTSEISPL